MVVPVVFSHHHNRAKEDQPVNRGRVLNAQMHKGRRGLPAWYMALCCSTNCCRKVSMLSSVKSSYVRISCYLVSSSWLVSCFGFLRLIAVRGWIVLSFLHLSCFCCLCVSWFLPRALFSHTYLATICSRSHTHSDYTQLPVSLITPSCFHSCPRFAPLYSSLSQPFFVWLSVMTISGFCAMFLVFNTPAFINRIFVSGSNGSSSRL